MTPLKLTDIDYGVGGPPLLHGASLEIEPGERVCVVGRNGAGKSTLLRLIDGTLTPDDGRVERRPETIIARLTQEVPADLSGTVVDVVADGLGDVGAVLAEFHRHAATLGPGADTSHLASLQARIDNADGWQLDQRVGEVLSRLELEGNARFEALSGGLKRRVLLARALVQQPDVLLLDEPTNHLDVDAIAWLENFLLGFPAAVVFVTHDRGFLRRLATRIVEIDRGTLTSWPGDYDNYLRRREERWQAEQLANQAQDRQLAQEEAWIRQGIKARRTRNEGRVRALEKLRRERAQRREQVGRVQMDVAVERRSGKIVVEADRAGFAYEDRTLVRDFSTTILRGDKIGIIGPNGSGKTTLIRLLLGELAPDRGTIRQGTRLDVAYFDQHRDTLDETLSAQDNVGGGREFIDIGGKQRHVLGYLQDFLFTPARARAPITALSGGERNRLLLAKLFARPANLLVLDEPTNDLDIETLELLEDRIGAFDGTVLLVSHDREFIDNVVTSTLVLEGEGRIGEYAGGYADWLRQRRTPTSGGKADTASRAAESGRGASAGSRGKRRSKLSYKDALELDALPERIEAMEAELKRLGDSLNAPELFSHEPERAQRLTRELAATQQALEQAYERWDALEAERDRLAD